MCLVLGPRFNLTIRIFAASHIQFASHCDVHVMLIIITREAVHVLIGVATLGAREAIGFKLRLLDLRQALHRQVLHTNTEKYTHARMS